MKAACRFEEIGDGTTKKGRPQRRRAAKRRTPAARRSRQARRRRPDREAGWHQPRRQGRQGRPALWLRRAGRGRRRPWPGRLRPRQGTRGARGDPQGDRAGQAQHDPGTPARGAHAAPRHQGPLRRRPCRPAPGRARHRHHRRRPDARHLRVLGRPGRGRQIGRHLQSLQHDQGHLRGSATQRQPAHGGAATRQEGLRPAFCIDDATNSSSSSDKSSR